MTDNGDSDSAADGIDAASASHVSRAMAQAFSSASASGAKVEAALASLTQKMAEMTARAAAPIKAFAAGGVIGTPSYFPMAGATGLAGEAGPEAIMPLQRAADGSLGVAAQGGGSTIHVHIATPDLDGFRRSESYVTGQIARAVARGQRNL